MNATVYEVRYATSSLFVSGISAAIDAAARLSDAHGRAEIHADGIFIAAYVGGTRLCAIAPSDRIAVVWPGVSPADVGEVLRAAVARRDRTGVGFVASLWVEAVLARDVAKASWVAHRRDLAPVEAR